MTLETITNRVQTFLSGNDSLRKSEYKGATGLTGHCYVASESIFHLTGGYGRWYVCRLSHEGETHWFLEDKQTGEIVDPTVDQFNTDPDYAERTRTGFMTKEPSNRAEAVIKEVS